jgi:hypothetical protein
MYASSIILANKGLHVFPCAPRGKTPICPHGCLDATTDPKKIDDWWQLQPNANVAIATGQNSNVWVLDIDGMAGELTLKELEAKHGALPSTVEVITGSGGRHLYFAWHDGIRNSAKQLGAGLDVRGQGGYVIAPPSIHPSGRQYHWSVDTAQKPVAAPAWLLDIVVPKGGIALEP